MCFKGKHENKIWCNVNVNIYFLQNSKRYRTGYRWQTILQSNKKTQIQWLELNTQEERSENFDFRLICYCDINSSIWHNNAAPKFGVRIWFCGFPLMNFLQAINRPHRNALWTYFVDENMLVVRQRLDIHRLWNLVFHTINLLDGAQVGSIDWTVNNNTLATRVRDHNFIINVRNASGST